MIFINYNSFYVSLNSEIENVNTDQTSMNAYAEVNAEWVMEVLPKQKPQDTNDKTVPDKILEMLDQEMDVPNVSHTQLFLTFWYQIYLKPLKLNFYSITLP